MIGTLCPDGKGADVRSPPVHLVVSCQEGLDGRRADESHVLSRQIFVQS